MDTMTSDLKDVAQIRWLPVYNTSGETVPAFAAMRISGIDSSTGVFTVAKPNTNDATANILFNGPVEIPAAHYGIATADFPASVRYETGDGTPVNGDEWGVSSGDWKLRNARSGFLIQATLDISNGIAVAVRSPLRSTANVYGRADSSPALPGHGPRPTINLKSGTGINIAIADDSTDNEIEWTISIDSSTAFSGALVTMEDGDQTISNNTSTPIEFDTEKYDTDAYWDAGTPSKFTAPTDGKYRIGVCCVYEAVAGTPGTANGQVYVQLTHEGVELGGSSYMSFESSTFFDHLVYTVDWVAEQGDEFEANTYQDSGANRTLVGTGGHAAKFWIQRLSDDT